MRLIGRSAQHCELVRLLDRIAPVRVEVLISGPTGVGKERYARYIHEQSGVVGPFVPLNCAAVPETLLENELFGHVAGAFTGARAQHEGVVALAEDGTLFLDEVDTLSRVNQAKLLRFLQEREYKRLGENRIRTSNVRVIAASNTNLAELVRAGHFREDLYFRLRVVPIAVPALRERRGDIEPLLMYFSEHYVAQYGGGSLEFSPELMQWFAQYDWPGNVRELENCVRYLAAMRFERAVEVGDVTLGKGGEVALEAPPAKLDLSAPISLGFQRAKRVVIENFERTYVACALAENGGNVSRAARASGKARRAFFELMRKYGLRSSEPSARGPGVIQEAHRLLSPRVAEEPLGSSD